MNAAAFPALLTAVSLMALLNYAVAAAVAERASGGLRWFLLAGWLLYVVVIGIDIIGIGT